MGNVRRCPAGTTSAVLLGLLLSAGTTGQASAQSAPAVGLFQRIVAASPALGRDDGSLIAALGRLRALPSPVRLDLSVGSELPDKPEGVVALARLLDGIKPGGLDYRSTVYPGENHNSVRLASFPSGLYWVYRPAGSP